MTYKIIKEWIEWIARKKRSEIVAEWMRRTEERWRRKS